MGGSQEEDILHLKVRLKGEKNMGKIAGTQRQRT